MAWPGGLPAEATRLDGHPDPERWAAAAARWEALAQPYPAAYAGWWTRADQDLASRRRVRGDGLGGRWAVFTAAGPRLSHEGYVHAEPPR